MSCRDRVCDGRRGCEGDGGRQTDRARMEMEAGCTATTTVFDDQRHRSNATNRSRQHGETSTFHRGTVWRDRLLWQIDARWMQSSEQRADADPAMHPWVDRRAVGAVVGRAGHTQTDSRQTDSRQTDSRRGWCLMLAFASRCVPASPTTIISTNTCQRRLGQPWDGFRLLCARSNGSARKPSYHYA